jgi:hypothetical protein
MGDYHRVVSMLITGGKFSEAINVMNDAPTEKVEFFLYKFAPILMENEPEKTIQMLLRKSHLSFSNLLPAVLHYTMKFDQTPKSSPPSENFAVKFLEFLIGKCGLSMETEDLNSEHSGINLELWMASTIEANLINTFVFLLAKYDSSKLEEKIFLFLNRLWKLRELEVLDEIVTVDAEYILRTCRLFQRQRSCVRALQLLRCPMQAIKEALKIDLKLAKSIAASEKNVETQRLLWLEVAGFIVANDPEIKKAISVVSDSDGIVQIEVRVNFVFSIIFM